MEKNAVIINKKVSKTFKILEVNGDIIVPDIKPDIVSIINTNGVPYIYKEDISVSKMRFDGNIDSYIVYLADNGETRSIQTTLSFSDSLEDNGIKEGCFSKEQVILESIEAKVLNERKISIKAIVKVKIEIFEKAEVEITSDFEEFENVEKLKETLGIRSLVGSNKIRTSIKEDISVDNSFSVAEILKTNVEITNIENKISYNKVLAKADANVKIVFLAEDGRIGMATSNIPVMSFIDIEKVADGHICDVTYSPRNMLFKVNSKEQHSVSCQIEFEVTCFAYEAKTIDVIQDMYGTKNNISFSKKEIMVPINNEMKKEKVNINERINVEDILNVLDVSSKVRKVNNTKSGNYYNCECETILNIYYEANSRNGLNVKEVAVPFVVRLENDDDIDFEIARKEFTVSNEIVNCDMEIFVKKDSENLKNVSCIENVECKECKDDLDYKMCIYFVKPGDTMWEIAKEFKVCMKNILAANNLETPDKIKAGDRLYIMK